MSYAYCMWICQQGCSRGLFGIEGQIQLDSAAVWSLVHHVLISIHAEYLLISLLCVCVCC